MIFFLREVKTVHAHWTSCSNVFQNGPVCQYGHSSSPHWVTQRRMFYLMAPSWVFLLKDTIMSITPESGGVHWSAPDSAALERQEKRETSAGGVADYGRKRLTPPHLCPVPGRNVWPGSPAPPLPSWAWSRLRQPAPWPEIKRGRHSETLEVTLSARCCCTHKLRPFLWAASRTPEPLRLRSLAGNQEEAPSRRRTGSPGRRPRRQSRCNCKKSWTSSTAEASHGWSANSDSSRLINSLPHLTVLTGRALSAMAAGMHASSWHSLTRVCLTPTSAARPPAAFHSNPQTQHDPLMWQFEHQTWPLQPDGSISSLSTPLTTLSSSPGYVCLVAERRASHMLTSPLLPTV